MRKSLARNQTISWASKNRCVQGHHLAAHHCITRSGRSHSHTILMLHPNHPNFQITVGLNDLAKSVAERNEIIATSGRNRQAVKLNMENQKKMDVLKDQWNLMKKLVDKEKRKGKGVRSILEQFFAEMEGGVVAFMVILQCRSFIIGNLSLFFSSPNITDSRHQVDG